MKEGAWAAPAKLNLFLHVTGRRGDGYHELQTLFQFLDYGDTLRCVPRRDGRIRLTTPTPGVPPDQDLVLRAARLLQSVAGAVPGADLALDKRLPLGGGLGGGSSDAATALVALDHLWGLGLGPDRLAGLGLQLGADVPVFVRGRAAWAEGVGERLTPVTPDEPWYLVIHPGCHVPTGTVFNSPELTRNTPPIKIPPFLQTSPRSGAAGALGALMRDTANDLEPLVRRLYPPVGAALNWLEGRGQVRMSGSGACVFSPFEHEADARALLRSLPGEWTGFVARGRNLSPLYAAAPDTVLPDNA